jgi:subtilisin family serine protease
MSILLDAAPIRPFLAVVPICHRPCHAGTGPATTGRQRMRRMHALLLGIATALAVGVAPGAHAAPATHDGPARAAAAAPAGGRPVAVTLITGDRVTVSGRSAGVEAAPGRAGVRFVSWTEHGHRHVVPADALALLSSGRVDARLFDVTALAGFGYDDRRADLPLLVAYSGSGERRQAAAAASVRGARVVRDLPVVGTLAVRADRAARTALWNSLTSGTRSARSLAPGVERLMLDGRRTVTLDHSVPQIGAPEAWKAGLDGTGVTVAVLDTGVDATHPDLAGRIAGAENFTTAASTDDTVGHGTHVASIIAGSGAASDGRYRGVAPGAKLLIGKVCGDESCLDSDILAGMAWAAPRAKVVNMSLGGGDTPELDPLEQAVDDLTARYGTLFVVAAGNDGGFAPVSSPASADAALAVGAVDRDDQLAGFSSRGPRVGDTAIKPDITAPGVDIVAARAAHGVIGGPAPLDRYTTLSGTSMATPHVSGAAAILTEEHPGWSPRQRKTVLMAAAKPTAGVDVFGQGAGRVDVARAISQTVSVDEGSVSFGRQLWPHGDDVPVTKTVTYRNAGAADVTVSLAVQSSAPKGTFTAKATSLTVPAGGTATTTVTADTRVAGPDGYRTGYLVASADGGLRVETPIGVEREVESYGVTLRHVNRDGSPSTEHLSVLTNLTTHEQFAAGDPTGTQQLRLPKGAYGLFSWVTTGGATETPADDTAAMLVQPKLAVTRAVSVTLDARKARPLAVTVPKRDAEPSLIAAGADWTLPHYTIDATLLALTFRGQYLGRLGPSAPVANFEGSVNTAFARRGTGRPFLDSPYTYDLAWYDEGRFFDGLVKAPRNRDLATIAARYAAEATGVEGVKMNEPIGRAGGFWAVAIPFRLPFQRTEYVNVDGGARWQAEFTQQAPPAGDDFPGQLSGSISPPVTYRAGHTYRQDWNRAVFAPSVAAGGPARDGDSVVPFVPLVGEGSGHPGWSDWDSAHVALHSGATLVGESDDLFAQFELPAAGARYRLDVTASRGAPHTLSTTVSGTWTFRSEHVPGDEPKPLPLSTVRFGPTLDDRNAAPAGRFDIPVTVERAPGSAAGPVRRLAVEVSYDEGRSWHRAPLRGSGDHRVATVRNPAGVPFAALRVNAVDAAGNAVTETVLRAYAIR